MGRYGEISHTKMKKGSSTALSAVKTSAHSSGVLVVRVRVRVRVGVRVSGEGQRPQQRRPGGDIASAAMVSASQSSASCGRTHNSD